jgi:hypothetical protein
MLADNNEGSASDDTPFENPVKWFNAYGGQLNANYATLDYQQELMQDTLFKDLRNEVIEHNKHLFKVKYIVFNV